MDGEGNIQWIVDAYPGDILDVLVDTCDGESDSESIGEDVESEESDADLD